MSVRFRLVITGSVVASLVFHLTAHAAVGSTPTPTPAPPPSVKSVTVSATSLTFGACSGGSSTPTALGFPNATCSTPSYTVTNNGDTTEEITISGSAATPSDQSANVWSLCGGTGATCTGSSAAPGADQYSESDTSAAGQTVLTTSAQCDAAFSTCSAVPAGGSASESLHITGPQTSTDTSPSFSMTIVYTAF
jgi:hypothetical protein